MYKLFGYVNNLDSHNKSRHTYLALEKLWVTQCVWSQLCPAVALGITMTTCWKIFCYRVKRHHFEKNIGIREFSERLALDCFNNTFSTDTGTPENNISPLDEFNEVYAYCTCRAVHFPVLFLLPQRSALILT